MRRENRGDQAPLHRRTAQSLARELHQLKGNRRVFATTVALPQNLLLAERRDMDHIIEVVRKIQSHSAAFEKA